MKTRSQNIESKRDKFVRLAEQRVNVILEQFRKLGNLANTRNYEYTEEDFQKIFAALNKAMKKTKTVFSNNGKGKRKRFTLGNQD